MATNPPIAIGEIADVPAAGSGVASAYHQKIAARIVQRFATAAARAGAAWPGTSLAKGTPSYLATGNETEGLELYNGTAWRKPWNMPWGFVAYANVGGADQAGIGAIADLTGYAVNVNAITGRWYLVTWLLVTTQQTAAGLQKINLSDGAADLGVLAAQSQATVGGANTIAGSKPFALATGAHALKLRGQTNAGTMTIASTTQANGVLAVTDIGPVVGGVPA
jgi:hypothetical protein